MPPGSLQPETLTPPGPLQTHACKEHSKHPKAGLALPEARMLECAVCPFFSGSSWPRKLSWGPHCRRFPYSCCQESSRVFLVETGLCFSSSKSFVSSLQKWDVTVETGILNIPLKKIKTANNGILFGDEKWIGRGFCVSRACCDGLGSSGSEVSASGGL